MKVLVDTPIWSLAFRKSKQIYQRNQKKLSVFLLAIVSSS
jgi:hypothetical protein